MFSALGTFVDQGDRVLYRVVREERVSANPQMMVYDAFDYEHHLGRHADFFWAADLIERGDDYLEYALGAKMLGVRTARQAVRITYVSQNLIEAEVLGGPARRLGTRIEAAPDPGGRSGRLIWTWTLELPPAIGRSVAARFASPAIALLLHAIGWRVSKQLAAVDFRAWAATLDLIERDEYVSHGIRIRGAKGSGASRRARFAIESVVRGCASCGRYELGFLHEGVIRCAECDFRAIHSGDPHRVELRGAQLACAPCADAQARLHDRHGDGTVRS